MFELVRPPLLLYRANAHLPLHPCLYGGLVQSAISTSHQTAMFKIVAFPAALFNAKVSSSTCLQHLLELIHVLCSY